MPIMHGIEATRKLVKLYPSIKIIALSMFDEDNMIAEMIDAGAKGYLLKNADNKEIIFAISTVNNNHRYYCETASKRLLHLISKIKNQSQVELTEFNDRVIRLICKQYTTQQIANMLFISKRTVDGHRLKIEDKMQVKNTAGLVVYALRNKIISEQEILTDN